MLQYLHYVVDKDDSIEWRFQGLFGFGGKLYNNRNGLYVSYYHEHTTHAREYACKLLNEKLAELINNLES